MSATRFKPVNAADPDQVEERSKSLRTEDERQAEAWKAVIATEDGRRVISEIIKRTFVFGECFTGHGAKDAYNLGARSVGIMVMNSVREASPDAFVNMLKESNLYV